MKALSPVSSLRMATAAAGLAILAISPAWADKYASIVVDMDTAKVLHARDADEPRYPASLTKVMTLYLVFDALDSGKLKLSDKLTVSKFAQHQQPSRLGLKAGQTITVEDAIRALVTKSANDVAVVLAEKLGGTEAKFAVKMTAKAKDLGLDHTTFKNASGLPNKAQLTTATDLEKLAEAMFKGHRNRYNYFSTPEFTWKRRHYENHNTLLAKVPGVDGIKTGYTNASGYNLMASAQRNGHRVIAVMLGGSTGRSRDEHVADLLEAAFLAIGGGSPIFAEGPSAIVTGAASKFALGPRPKNPADALAWDQLQKFAAIDAAEQSASSDPAGVSKKSDDSTEEGDSSEDAADAADDDDAPAKPAKPAKPAVIVAAGAAPVLVAVSAAPTGAQAVAVLAAPAPVAPQPPVVHVEPAAAPAAPIVDSPLLAPAPAGK
jgi:D-alanyl-D-alanine carboxypeptidase